MQRFARPLPSGARRSLRPAPRSWRATLFLAVCFSLLAACGDSPTTGQGLRDDGGLLGGGEDSYDCQPDQTSDTIVCGLGTEDTVVDLDELLTSLGDSNVTSATSMWIQAWGGDGLTSEEKTSGRGGMAQLATSLAELEKVYGSDLVLSYYIGDSGSEHDYGGGGGAASLVAVASTGSTDVSYLVIAGGGGGEGGTSDPSTGIAIQGGDGGDVFSGSGIACLGDDGSADDSAYCASGGTPDASDDLIQAKGGSNGSGGSGGETALSGGKEVEDSGTSMTLDSGVPAGMGGGIGNSPATYVGWVNDDSSTSSDGRGAVGGKAKATVTAEGGGGGGGYGGGGGGGVLLDVDYAGGGGGGGGSVVVVSAAIADTEAPSSFVEKPSTSGTQGYVQIVFNLE